MMRKAKEESPTFVDSSRLMRNFKKLETVYFLTRCRQIVGKSLTRHSLPLSSENGRQGGRIGPFLEGLCKYLSFSKLRVKADLKQGDLLNTSNLLCALAFDRDGDIFATAGVNKKIKYLNVTPL